MSIRISAKHFVGCMAVVYCVYAISASWRSTTDAAGATAMAENVARAMGLSACTGFRRRDRTKARHDHRTWLRFETDFRDNPPENRIHHSRIWPCRVPFIQVRVPKIGTRAATSYYVQGAKRNQSRGFTYSLRWNQTVRVPKTRGPENQNGSYRSGTPENQNGTPETRNRTPEN